MCSTDQLGGRCAFAKGRLAVCAGGDGLRGVGRSGWPLSGLAREGVCLPLLAHEGDVLPASGSAHEAGGQPWRLDKAEGAVGDAARGGGSDPHSVGGPLPLIVGRRNEGGGGGHQLGVQRHVRARASRVLVLARAGRGRPCVRVAIVSWDREARGVEAARQALDRVGVGEWRRRRRLGG